MIEPDKLKNEICWLLETSPHLPSAKTPRGYRKRVVLMAAITDELNNHYRKFMKKVIGG